MSVLLLDQAVKMEEGTATDSQMPVLSVYTSLLESLQTLGAASTSGSCAGYPKTHL